MNDFVDKILPLFINGHYSDWFFKIVVGQFFSFIQHNFALLWLIAITLRKGAKLTKNKYDDILAAKLVNFLAKFNKPLNKEE